MDKVDELDKVDKVEEVDKLDEVAVVEKFNNSLETIDNLINEKGIKSGVFPGAVLGIVRHQETLYQKAYGYAQLKGDKRLMQTATLFDLASLTKVIATTTAIMQLLENGAVKLGDYLTDYFPGASTDKDKITILNLLTHTSGFKSTVKLWSESLDRKEKIRAILNSPLRYKTGAEVVYSDPNFILLGELVARVSGQPLDRYTSENIFKPLDMQKTLFNPLMGSSISLEEIAATEWCRWRQRIIIGEVHDENAASLNGVSGHAGLFSNIEDLSVFVKMLINQGSYQGVRILQPDSVALMVRNWTPGLSAKRALGWDLRDNPHSSGGVLLSPRAFGHTGFTGTSLWIDPVYSLGIIFLTNRVHPHRDNKKIVPFRPQLHNLIVNTII